MADPLVMEMDVASCRPTAGSKNVCITSAATYLQRDILSPTLVTVCVDSLEDWVGDVLRPYVDDGRLNCVSREWSDVFAWIRDSKMSRALELYVPGFVASGWPRSWVGLVMFMLQDQDRWFLVPQFVSLVLTRVKDMRVAYMDLVSYAVCTVADVAGVVNSPIANIIGALCDFVVFSATPCTRIENCNVNELAAVGNLVPHYEFALSLIN